MNFPPIRSRDRGPMPPDVEWLEGWAKRIALMLQKDRVSYLAGLIFRPDAASDSAMLRYSIKYPTLVAALRESVDECERWLKDIPRPKFNDEDEYSCDDDAMRPSTPAEAILAEGMEILARRIRVVTEQIRANEGTTKKVKPKTPAAKGAAQPFDESRGGEQPLVIDAAAMTIIWKGKPIPLKNRTTDFKVFSGLYAKLGTVIAHKDIARIIKGNGIFSDSSTVRQAPAFVKHSILRLRGAFKLHKLPFKIEAVSRAGYMLSRV